MRAPTIVFLSFLAAGPSTEPVYFVEMREHAGIEYRNTTGEPEKRYIVSSLGTGAALFDYDEDGDLDLYLVNGARLKDGSVIPVDPNRLYRNEGDWRFSDVSGFFESGFAVVRCPVCKAEFHVAFFMGPMQTAFAPPCRMVATPSKTREKEKASLPLPNARCENDGRSSSTKSITSTL